MPCTFAPPRYTLRAACLCLVATALSVPSRAEDQALPPHQVFAEESHEKRHSVSVRIERRLDESDAVRVATTLLRRATPAPARSNVNFFLPGMAMSQGAWAMVSFNPRPKFVVFGLKLEDERALIAEHRADKRPLLGSWLTSPPAAAGRLSIYSEAGKIFAEWRLRNGQRTIDEVQDVSTANMRRFLVPGGGNYTLSRSGDLEIWSGQTLVAIGERIRERSPAAVVSTASTSPRAAVTGAPVAAALHEASNGSTPTSEARSNLTAGRSHQVNQAPAAAQRPLLAVEAARPPLAQPAALDSSSRTATRQASSASRDTATLAKLRNRKASKPSAAQRTAKAGSLTTGDRIAAKFSGDL